MRSSHLSRKHKQFLNLACKVAETSDCNNRHGAVIVKGGRVLAVGVNKFRNHPQFVKRFDCCSVHAEIDAIRRAGECVGATIYVARVTSRGPALSRPCNVCYAGICKAGIKEIIYT